MAIMLNKQLRNTFISYLLFIKIWILNVSLTKCNTIFSLDFIVQIEFAYHSDRVLINDQNIECNRVQQRLLDESW